MKKYFIVALASVAALTLASCVKESSSNMTEEKTINNSQELITITARIPEGGFTKVDLAEASYGGAINLTWHAGDKIIVTDADNASNTQEFTLTDGKGTAEGTFTGKAVTADSYIIVYDSIGDEFEFSEQTQAADATTDHLKYKATLEGVDDYTDFEFSDMWAASAGGTYTSSSVLRVRADIAELDPGAVNAVILKSDAAIFAGGKELTVLIDEPGNDNGEQDFITVYATLPEGDQAIAAGTELIIQFQMSDKEYDKYTVYRQLGAGTITGGKVNGFNINCRDNEDHFTNLKFANKSDENIGKAENPYLIGDQHQMAAMHSELSATEKVYFKLVDDVDLTDVEWVSLNNSGTYDYEIDFDGNHKVVSNLSCTSGGYPSFAGVAYGSYKDVTFDHATIDGGSNNIGVFAGYIGTVVNDGADNRDATCSGIIVSNSTVTGAAAKQGRNAGVFAGVVGVPNASITNCHVTGTNSVSQTGTTYYKQCCVAGFIGNVSTSAEITNCTATADVHNNLSYYTGGFIGQIGAAVPVTVSNCAFLGGTITANRPDGDSNSPVGGFIGRVTSNAGASFTNCYVDGAHITALHSGRCAGFVGDGGDGATRNTFTSCYVKNSSVSASQHCGGFVGTYGNFSKCYVESTTITANNNNVGGFSGYFENSIVTNCYASATVIGGTYNNIGGFIGNCRLGGNVPAQATCCYSTSTVSGEAASVGAFIGGVTVVPNSVTKNIAWNGTLNFIGSDGGLDITTAIVDNYIGASGTISSQAQTLGWDETVWDLNGSVPVLK